MQKSTINIGTRGSNLALWQARAVQEALMKAFPEIEVNIVIIKTKGDAVLDLALSKIGDKGLFTREIEEALLDGRIDIAVHSLKDLPTQLPDNLTLGGVLPRGEVRDVLISRDGRSLEQLNANARIGTSSLRRQAQILNYNRTFKVVDIRGNVNTRLRKLYEGHCDAVIMAGAGILRLGMQDKISQFLDTDIMLPAVSQGAVAMEIRDGDAETASVVRAITDDATWHTTTAERVFLRIIEGGCQVPVGCYSEVSGNQIKLTGLVASVDGEQLLRESLECPLSEAGEKAARLAEKLLNDGGREILEAIR